MSDSGNEVRNKGRNFLLALFGVALGLSAIYAVAVVHYSGRTFAKTTVAGIEIGGMPFKSAETKLATEIVPLASKPINVQVADHTYTIDPKLAGISVDAAKTITQVPQRPWSPLDLWNRAAGEVELTPVVTADSEKLTSAIAAISAQVDKLPVEPQIVFENASPKLIDGKPGQMLAADSAQKLLVNSFPTSSDPLVLQFASVNPSVSDAQAQEFISTAKSAVASPITVTVGKKEGTIKPADLAKALTYVGADGEFVPQIDGAVLVNSLKSQIHGIGNTAVDASFKIFNGKPYVVPGKNGTGINPDKIAQAVLQVIDQTAPRVVDLELAQTKPDFTDADAKALGITEKLSSFTQNFPYAAYRVQNIGTAARYLDGKIIKPGEVFSMNDTVHERTVANGYTVGYIVGPGGQLLKDLGGGVSTATTAVWSAAFYANMQRVEQRAHSIWIPRYTAGLEATVSWGSLDLKWRNTSKHGVLIKSYITDNSVTVTLYGTKEFDQVKAEFSPRRNTTQYGTIHSTIDGCEYQGGQNGFDITVTRVVTVDGRVVKREPFNTHYSPEPVVICGKPAAPVASPSASHS